MTYKKYDVVTVPFPFTGSAAHKRRPALVLSNHVAFNEPIGHSVMAMITSEKMLRGRWMSKLATSSRQACRSSPWCMKLFTLDHRFVVSKMGTLSDSDRVRLGASLLALLGE